jgi:uncharacterized membrane protein YfcA
LPLPLDDLALLSAILGVGFLVEAVAGFGGTVIALSLGARWFPIEQLLAWFLPLNLALSTTLAVRHRAHIDRALLVRRVLPAMLLGLAAGTALSQVLPPERGAAVFAAIVVAVAVLELVRLRTRTATATAAPPRPLPRPLALAVLGVAGVVHGLFATGGPLAVAVINRGTATKAALRATLAVLWLTLNVIVTARLVADGALDGRTLETSAVLVVALVVGLAAGERIHRRVPERPFRYLVAALLGVTGALLLARFA